MRFILVYQCGVANVFRVGRGRKIRATRMIQSAFTECEWYCAGAIAAGASVEVMHCDRAGDIFQWQEIWEKGKGSMFEGRKHPPYEAVAA